MNCLYITLCFSIVSVLIKLNDAHGLTTFGKSQSIHPQTPPPFHPAKSCINHTQCKPIPQTSCIADIRDPSKKYCLCGDNTAPTNGLCQTTRKGAGHLCSDDCVEDATCLEEEGNSNIKVCKCNEGFIVTPHGYCSGAVSAQIATVGLLLMVMLHFPILTTIA
ncbi:uncharacterized protein LOC112906024 isoform X2 [Agrilus planipennis]|uniref:Uncharacterized protein LOC112906024 isoform X2 n=1 Tax=Agrilus planipennis TaxID=224129 RepID=A0A7F5RH98_AGRPL|nr:uncharacterized protein LOC112906024 isoform X2 [Agrilus planipennis]